MLATIERYAAKDVKLEADFSRSEIARVAIDVLHWTHEVDAAPVHIRIAATALESSVETSRVRDISLEHALAFELPGILAELDIKDEIVVRECEMLANQSLTEAEVLLIADQNGSIDAHMKLDMMAVKAA